LNQRTKKNASPQQQEASQRKRRYKPAQSGPSRGPHGGMRGRAKFSMSEQGKTIKRILKMIFKNYKFSLLVVLICIVVQALAIVQAVLFLQTLIDSYILPILGQENPDFGPLAQALQNLSIFLAFGILCAYGFNRIMVNISQGTLRRLRIEVFDKMESLPLKFFDTHSHGDVMSVYTNDIDTLRQLISQALPQTFNALISIVLTFTAMCILDIPLTILATFMVGVMLFTTAKLGGKAGGYFVDQQADLGEVNGFIEEMIKGQKVVKVFCHEKANIEDFRVINESLRESACRANSIGNILMPVNANIGNLSYVLCAIVGSLVAISGITGLTLGTLVAFLALNRSFTQPVSQVSVQINNIVMAAAGAERVFKLMDEAPEVDEGDVRLVRVKEMPDDNLEVCDERTGAWAWKHENEDGSFDLRRLRGAVELHDVTFGYTDDKIVLHDVSLFAKPGQKIAFVGATGAGKTTITNLINRFYDVQEGSITYDGIDVRKIRKADLRRSLGMVLQDTHLFTGTVMDNIRYGRLDATDEECIEAAKLANADGFIRRLPNGYDTILTGDGSNLSQGQRQLLAIARAGVANPPALILDEATSSIDTRTEALVQQGMDALMADRTTFVIAHRLSTVYNANCIMVVDHGRIIERGTHDELIQQKGRYYRLYTGKSQ
jgi:ATP-binding cassette subfamily B multidrug efflux pump